MRTLHAEGDGFVHRRRGARHSVRYDRRAGIRQAGEERGGLRRSGKPLCRGVSRRVRKPHASGAAREHNEGPLAAGEGGTAGGNNHGRGGADGERRRVSSLVQRLPFWRPVASFRHFRRSSAGVSRLWMDGRASHHSPDGGGGGGIPPLHRPAGGPFAGRDPPPHSAR